jgi:hypothetical protein
MSKTGQHRGGNEPGCHGLADLNSKINTLESIIQVCYTASVLWSFSHVKTEPLTFRELAAKLCALDGRTSDDIETVTQQLRGAHQRELLKHSDESGPRGALRISDDMEFCRARALLILIDLGIQGDTLRQVNALMSAKTSRPAPNGPSIKGGLAAAVEGIRKGETWFLRVNVVRDRLQGGKLDASAKFVRKWELADELTPATDGEIMGCNWLSHSIIPISDLFRPLIVGADA